MKILCVIDHFGSGGAQRQIVELACGLARRGHVVEVFAYFPEYDFFRPRLDASGVKVHYFAKGRGVSLKALIRLASLLRVGRYDAAVAFLRTPGIYLELAGLFAPATKVVVSERSSFQRESPGFAQWVERFLHRMADRVVANSRSHADWLRARYAWLASKVACVYNGVAIPELAAPVLVPSPVKDLRLLVVGRIGPEKNALNILRALALFGERFGWIPRVGWVGKSDESDSGRAYRAGVDAFLAENQRIAERWTWMGERRDVAEVVADHHALLHASFFEGLPNVVCEALSLGKPVVLSNVCDHPYLVAEGERGFLFDPNDPASIADALGRLAAMEPAQWRSMSKNCRDYAIRELEMGRMLDRFEGILRDIVAERSGKPR